ncbi:MAG: PadR family transcriptional regulator [Arachnia sp.]
MEHAMHHPFTVPGMRDIARQMFTEADGGEPRGRRGGPRGHRGHGGRGFGPGFGGPMPGFGGPFGPRGGRRRRGDVRLAALLLIAEAPRNGYQIIQELESRTDGRWKPSPGAIYPALNQLEDEGLIRAVDADAGKIFEITDAGRAEAEAAAQQPAPWEHQGDEDPAHALAHSMRQMAQAVGAIVQSGDAELIAKATAELDELKRKLYQLLAES